MRTEEGIEVSRYAECSVCGKPLEFYDSPQGSWWSHFEHPTDEHDADPILSNDDLRAMRQPTFWLNYQARDRDVLVQILWRSAMPGYEPIGPEHPDWAFYLHRAEDLIADPFIRE